MTHPPPEAYLLSLPHVHPADTSQQNVILAGLRIARFKLLRLSWRL